MGSYVPNTPAQRREMLGVLGLGSMEELYRDVPASMLVRDGLHLPRGLSEWEVRGKVTALAEGNRIYPTILRGAGAYRHFIPRW